MSSDTMTIVLQLEAYEKYTNLHLELIEIA